MLRLDRVIKPWKESAALNDHINLYGFWNETASYVEYLDATKDGKDCRAPIMQLLP